MATCIHEHFCQCQVTKYRSIMRKCEVVTCNNKGVHRFPSDETLKRQWLKATRVDQQRRLGWRLRKCTSICSAHFNSHDFEIRRGRRLLKLSAIPSKFTWSDALSNETSETELQDIKPFESENKITFNPMKVVKTYSKPECPAKSVEQCIKIEDAVEVKIEYDPLDISEEVRSDLSSVPDGQGVQESIMGNKSYHFSVPKCETSTQTDQNAWISKESDEMTFSLCKYSNYHKTIHFYTGLETYDKAMFVFGTLGDCSSMKYIYGEPPKKLPKLEQFFITLMILRRHTEFEEIAALYVITIQQVANIFITWVRFMASQWKHLDHMPLGFNHDNAKKGTVIDAEMLNTFKILKYPMNRTESYLVSDIAFICAKLANFSRNILNKKS